MSAAPRLQGLARRFDRLSLRERALVVAAALAVLVGLFNVLLLNRLDTRRARLSAELSGLEASVQLAPGATASADPNGEVYRHAAELAAQLERVTAELNSRSGGMIPPQRMVEVIHEMLGRQRNVKLVSLHKLAPIELPPRTAGEAQGAAPHPCIQAVELELEGNYLDILAYLRSVEALPWHLYWRRLDLATTEYPKNRVRLELGTLSIDSQWMGL